MAHLTESKQFVGLVALLAAAAVLAPYFSPLGFATAGQQDFTATGIALPSFISKNFGFSVQATFANLGSVSGSHVVYSYEIYNQYNRVFYSEGSTDLLAGQPKTLSLTVDDELVPGKYTIRVVVDSDNAYTESDESNNAYSMAFTVPYP